MEEFFKDPKQKSEGFNITLGDTIAKITNYRNANRFR
jgi:hypothetical protein